MNPTHKDDCSDCLSVKKIKKPYSLDSELLYQDDNFNIVKQIDGYIYIYKNNFTICICKDYLDARDIANTINKNSIIFI